MHESPLRENCTHTESTNQHSRLTQSLSTATGNNRDSPAPTRSSSSPNSAWNHSCPRLVAPIISVCHARKNRSETFHGPFCWSSGQTQSSLTASLGRVSEFSGSMREGDRAFPRSRGMRWDSSLGAFADRNSEKTRQAKSNAFRSISHHAQFFEPHTDFSTLRSLVYISLSLASQGNDWREMMNLAQIDRDEMDWN
ncbi:hypothetical protein C8J56DRAFT_346487 [Mycena floridula]|nr:hypothetical protein C8J56DRAFT_346487 [Mycena floridula]